MLVSDPICQFVTATILVIVSRVQECQENQNLSDLEIELTSLLCCILAIIQSKDVFGNMNAWHEDWLCVAITTNEIIGKFWKMLPEDVAWHFI